MDNEKFREFVQTKGLTIYHNRQALCGVVADIFVHNELLKNVLHTAILNGVAERLVQNSDDTLAVTKTVKYLTQKHGIGHRTAEQAVYTLTYGLGMQTEPPQEAIEAMEAIFFAGHEWLILDTRHDATLILCKNIIEKRLFHNTYEKVTWSTSDCYFYLNNEFYMQIPEQDKIRIVETDVGKIFLLSVEEALRYFGEDNKKRLAYDAQKRPCGWWLRSPGEDAFRAASVWGGGAMLGGKIHIRGDFASGYEQGIRPALWVLKDSHQRPGG